MNYHELIVRGSEQRTLMSLSTAFIRWKIGGVKVRRSRWTWRIRAARKGEKERSKEDKNEKGAQVRGGWSAWLLPVSAGVAGGAACCPWPRHTHPLLHTHPTHSTRLNVLSTPPASSALYGVTYRTVSEVRHSEPERCTT